MGVRVGIGFAWGGGFKVGLLAMVLCLFSADLGLVWAGLGGFRDWLRVGLG